ncbi:MAG TPA: hypothetical protein DCM62_06900 [Bacteroidales bacterium]|nr:hypothetical protein [Bacteroidales bacterium]
MDTVNPNVGFFEIPKYTNWADFKALTTKVKYETSILFFDAATGYLFENQQLIDLVRIYKDQMSPERIAPIRERYLKLLD